MIEIRCRGKQIRLRVGPGSALDSNLIGSSLCCSLLIADRFSGGVIGCQAGRSGILTASKAETHKMEALPKKDFHVCKISKWKP